MRVQLARVEAGAVVGTDVHNRAGQLVLPAGTTITQRHLIALAGWDIRSVVLVSAEDSPDAPADRPNPSMRRQLEQRFSRLDRTHPLVAELYAIALQRLSRGATT